MAKAAKDDAAHLNVSPDTIVDAVADLTEYKEKVTTAAGKYQARRKHWKKLGVNLTVLDAIMTLKRMDEADVQADEVDRQRYARWLGVELGFQTSLDLPEPTPAVKDKVTKHDAYWQGHAAGKRGDPRTSNPADTGTIAHAAFDQGWNDGDTEAFNGAKVVPIKPNKGKAGGEMGPKKKADKQDAVVSKNDGGDTVQ